KAAESRCRYAHDVEDGRTQNLMWLRARVNEVARSLETSTGAAEQDDWNVLLIVRSGGLFVAPNDERGVERGLAVALGKSGEAAGEIGNDVGVPLLDLGVDARDVRVAAVEMCDGVVGVGRHARDVEPGVVEMV